MHFTTKYMQLHNKLSTLFGSLDNQVTINLKSAEVITRPSKSNGLWCCVLLPIILNVYMLQYPVLPLYKLVAILSIGFLAYSILFIIFLSLSCTILKETAYGGCIASSLISALLMYTILGYDLSFCLFHSIPSVFMYSILLKMFLTKFQSTFTIGEVMVLTQGVIFFTVMATAKITGNFDKSDQELDFVYTVIYEVFAIVAIILTALSLLTEKQRNLESLAYIIGTSALFGLIILHCTFGYNIIYRLLDYIFLQNNRSQVFLFWLVLLAISLMVLTIRTRLAVKASTVTRKSFHVLASLVFMSGILLDVNLMILASGIVFGLLLIVETLRKSKIEPISSALQSAFDVYSDEKDRGCFAVTPLYLYLGLACPLVLVPKHAGYELELLSGVLSVGVGDTAASWFGSKYGFNKWSGGDRTYEGTAFNILSQVTTVYALVLFELLNAKNALIRASIAATITGLVEAKTNQVDNLVLPLVTIISFQISWFLS